MKPQKRHSRLLALASKSGIRCAWPLEACVMCESPPKSAQEMSYYELYRYRRLNVGLERAGRKRPGRDVSNRASRYLALASPQGGPPAPVRLTSKRHGRSAGGFRKVQVMAATIDVRSAMAVAELRSALRRFLRRSELAAAKCGLTPQRYHLLLMVKGAPDGSGRATVGELSERLQLAQSTTTELVARSVEAGLVERESSTNDARVVYLRLTSEGERRLACAFTALETERQQLFEAMAAFTHPSGTKPWKQLGKSHG